VSLRVGVLAATCLPWHRPGGLERHVLQLCRWLRKRDVAVDLFLSRPEYDVDPFHGDDGFQLSIVPGTPFLRRPPAVVLSRNTLYPLFSLRMGRRLVEAARERSYAAVIAQGLTGLGYATFAKRLGAAPPLILNPQGMEEALTQNPWKYAAYVPFRALLRFAASRAAVVVATDEVLEDTVIALLGVPRSRVAVIPNAIDVAECETLARTGGGVEARESLGLGEASPLIVTTGRLAENKGFEVGLTALSKLRSQIGRNWVWVVVGEGPRRGDLEREAARQGLAAHIRFVGRLPDDEMHGLLAACDLFLNPTLFEGSSLVTLEAMSHACAVVATRAGGIPDKIEEGATGWLAEPGDADSLVAAVLRWHGANPATRQRIRQSAAQRCRERFDWPVCVDRYLAAISRLSVGFPPTEAGAG
jgi:glycosyltransferase involved in cell wall biosynthesis